MISFNNVFLKYTKEYFALSDVSFTIKEGERVAFVGPKDSGKTCVIRLIAGLEKADSGEIYISDTPVDKVDYSTDVSMGYVPHKSIFFVKKSVYDNLKYVLDIRHIKHEAVEEKINKALSDFNIENIAQEKIYKLTPFQKYLVSFARLSLRKIDILLVDNIFEDLSTAECREIIKIIKKYFSSSTILISTSSLEVAEKMECRNIYLKYGAIVDSLEEEE